MLVSNVVRNVVVLSSAGVDVFWEIRVTGTVVDVRLLSRVSCWLDVEVVNGKVNVAVVALDVDEAVGAAEVDFVSFVRTVVDEMNVVVVVVGSLIGGQEP